VPGRILAAERAATLSQVLEDILQWKIGEG
jgi:hypothetical protein